MVPTARGAVLDLDGVVLRHQSELFEQWKVAVVEVSEVLARVWSWHAMTVACGLQGVEERPCLFGSRLRGLFDEHVRDAIDHGVRTTALALAQERWRFWAFSQFPRTGRALHDCEKLW